MSIRSTSCDMSLAGTRRPIVPFGATTLPNCAAASWAMRPSLMLVVDDQRHRPRPAAAGQPAGERRHVGHEIGRFLGALDRQRERLAARAALHLAAIVRRHRPAGTGRQAVNGFGRQRDQLPFGQCLNSTMNNVAGILGVTNIDNNRRHRQAYEHARHYGQTSSRGRAERPTGPVFPRRRILNYIVLRATAVKRFAAARV